MENILRNKIKKFSEKLSRQLLDLECEILTGDYNSELKNKKREIELATMERILDDYINYFKYDSLDD